MLKVMEFKLHLARPSSPSSSCQESCGPLARRPSTVSLPGKRFSQQVGSLQKTRLSYSLKRIRRRKKGDGASGSDSLSLSQLPESYTDLKKIHSEFEQFLNVVVEDLSEKMENLQKYKNSDTVSAHDKNFVNLQLYMLVKYKNRIENFKTVSSRRVETICLAHNKKSSSDSVTDLVNKVTHFLVFLRKPSGYPRIWQFQSKHFHYSLNRANLHSARYSTVKLSAR